ncbi:hypothetical protein MTO96_020359 [Rhipicephalus appendiculatus]
MNICRTRLNGKVLGFGDEKEKERTFVVNKESAPSLAHSSHMHRRGVLKSREHARLDRASACLQPVSLEERRFFPHRWPIIMIIPGERTVRTRAQGEAPCGGNAMPAILAGGPRHKKLQEARNRRISCVLAPAAAG